MSPPPRGVWATRGSVARRGWEFKGNLRIRGRAGRGEGDPATPESAGRPRLRRARRTTRRQADETTGNRAFFSRRIGEASPVVLSACDGRPPGGSPPGRDGRRHRRPAHGRPKAEDAEAKRRNNARPVMRRRCAAGPGWTYERGLSGQHDAGVAIDLISDNRVEGLSRPQNLGAGLGASFRYFSGLYFASCGCA